MEPCYTRLRPYDPTRRAEDGHYHCKQCGERLSGRRTAFCSGGCETLYRIPRDWNVAKHEVVKRDGGVCGECGRDTTQINAEMGQMMTRYYATRTRTERAVVYGEFEDFKARLRREGFRTSHLYIAYGARARFSEIDHIVPVVEGGGGCGLDNLRTLCTPCHKRVTAEMTARRAQQKKGAR